MEVKEHIRKDVANENAKQKEKKGIKENPVKIKRSVTHVKKEDKNKMYIKCICLEGCLKISAT